MASLLDQETLDSGRRRVIKKMPRPTLEERDFTEFFRLEDQESEDHAAELNQLKFKIRMNNQAKVFEISQSNKQYMKCTIINRQNNHVEYSFTLKESDSIVYDTKLLSFKFVIE